MSFGDLSGGVAPIYLHLVGQAWLVSQTSRQRANQFRLNDKFFRTLKSYPLYEASRPVLAGFFATKKAGHVSC